MKSVVCALAAAAACLALGGIADAAVLFDNGGASVPGSGGTDLVDFTVADDFVLLADGRITGGTFDFDGLPTSRLEGLQYYVYANFKGALYDLPGPQLATGGLTVTHVAYLGDPGYIPHTRATFELETPFLATGGVRYWFGLHQVANEGVSWTVPDFTTTHTAMHRRNDDPGSWRVFDYNRAFTLTGTAVPEPASWSLMILGLAGAGSALRRGLSRAAVPPTRA